MLWQSAVKRLLSIFLNWPSRRHSFARILVNFIAEA